MDNKKASYSLISGNKNLKFIFLVLFFVVLTLMIFIYRYYFWPFIFALIFYIALKPVYDFVFKYVRNALVSRVILLISFMLLVVVPIFFLLASLAQQTEEFYQLIAHQIDPKEIQQHIQNNKIVRDLLVFLNIEQNDILYISEKNLVPKVIAYLEQTTFSVSSNLKNIITLSINIIVNFFFMLLILFFLFKEGYKIKDSFYNILPFPKDIEEDVFNRLRQVIKLLITGNFLIMIIQGFMVGLGFLMCGLKIPLLAGSIAAILSLIPVVGTSLVWLPGAIYLLYTGDYFLGSLLVIWCMFWYLMLENIVKPQIFGKKMNFHPLIFFFLLLGSIKAFNLPGVIIGPILLTLFYSLWEIYKILDVYGVDHPSGNDNVEI